MKELIEELSKLSLEYRKRSDDLECINNRTSNIDWLNDGKSQAYWIVSNDLINLIRRYDPWVTHKRRSNICQMQFEYKTTLVSVKRITN